MSRVAIVGAGNLGAFLGAHLQLAGHDVFFCARRRVPAVQVDGLPTVCIPHYLEAPPSADIVLLTVKSHDTASTYPWLTALCRHRQPVAVVQNGIHHAERIPGFKAIPVLSYVYVEQTQDLHRAFEPARAPFTVPASESSDPFVGLFKNTAISIECDPQFHVAAWRKMLHNCVSNPLTAFAGRGLEILHEPLYRSWAQRILAESLPIARADGAALSDAEDQSVLDVLASYPPGTRTSMLQDRERGKRLELDALNGALIKLGRLYGLPTPVNEDMVRRLAPKLT